MSREDFEGLNELAKQNHDKRVAKNPDRVAYAIEQFKRNSIEYVLKNTAIGHFHCHGQKSDKLFQFWAGTGKILGYESRGIHNFIDLVKKN